MVKKIDTAIVSLWGENVGAVSWFEAQGYAFFEYTQSFLKKKIDISPIHMAWDDAMSVGHGGRVYSFPALNKTTFLGLPGLLADMLPDKFGNAVIDAWLARNGRAAESFSPIERLCYTGRRGMGALEFTPPVNHNLDAVVPVEVKELVLLAQEIMNVRSGLDVSFSSTEKENNEAMLDILRVGSSVGGARPKALIALNEHDKVISGQGEVPAGFQCWLLKFDGINDREPGALSGAKGYGRIEYAYSLMAKEAGIVMPECRLFEENGRAHFLVKRFDRVNNQKIHMQSLCGLAHFDFNQAGAYSYEQAFGVMRKLRMDKAEAEQQFRRMVFNVIARNQDDHTKNIAFLMGRDGRWRLSPAFDITYSHNPTGKWTGSHQMSINGKRDNFTMEDFIVVGRSIGLPNPKHVVEEIVDVVSGWSTFAQTAKVDRDTANGIAGTHRLRGLGNTEVARPAGSSFKI